MLTLSIDFLAGRYHATSWEHHVNEGTVEWPPSPWRIVRALAAASFKLDPELPVELRRRALEPLLAPPSYSVPPATTGHTRHYMPTDDKPTKVFDAFVAAGGTLEVAWPDVALDAESLRVLDRVLRAVTYLGRAESWVEVRRVDAPVAPLNCAPDPAGELRLWALQPPAEYEAWRREAEAAQARLPRKQRREVPAGWWEVVHLDTGRLYRDGWSRPPGTRAVPYRFEPREPARRRRAVSSRLPTVARFEIASAVPPRRTLALSVGDRVRQALLDISDGHLVFVGRDVAGNVERAHDHASFLASDDDADGRLDHVVVHARRGFDRAALHALEALRRVWGHGGHDLELVLVGTGDPEDLGCLWREARDRAASPLLGEARVWESHTPFVPPRHIKVRGGEVRDAPAQQVARLLAARGFPEAVMEPLDARELSAPQPSWSTEWYCFQRLRRAGGGRRGSDAAFGFRLRFPVPVRGPISLGYGAYQGLGAFVAIE